LKIRIYWLDAKRDFTEKLWLKPATLVSHTSKLNRMFLPAPIAL